jgi:hypothetical protein
MAVKENIGQCGLKEDPIGTTHQQFLINRASYIVLWSDNSLDKALVGRDNESGYMGVFLLAGGKVLRKITHRQFKMPP